MASLNPRLLVAAGPLRAAFATLDELLPERSKQSAELVLGCVDGALRLEGPGAELRVPATGTWSGRLRVSASFVRMLALAMPDGDPLVLEYCAGRLVLRGETTLRFKAAWEDISPPRVEVALDLEDVGLLKLATEQRRDALQSSGLSKLIGAAEARFQQALNRAFQAFADYPISRDKFESALRSVIIQS